MKSTFRNQKKILFLLFSLCLTANWILPQEILGNTNRDKNLIENWRKWFKKFPPPKDAIKLEMIASFPNNKARNNVFLWKPRDITLSPNGLIAVNDQKAKCIFLFNDTGKLLQVFGKPGQGPGEFSNPYIS